MQSGMPRAPACPPAAPRTLVSYPCGAGPPVIFYYVVFRVWSLVTRRAYVFPFRVATWSWACLRGRPPHQEEPAAARTTAAAAASPRSAPARIHSDVSRPLARTARHVLRFASLFHCRSHRNHARAYVRGLLRAPSHVLTPNRGRKRGAAAPGVQTRSDGHERTGALL